MRYNKDIIEATHYFIRIVELGSYSAVKKDCSVEINTIKSKINSLENHLGVTLVKNIKNTVSPTNFGIKYYKSCNKRYKDLEKIVDTMKQNYNTENNSLKILGTPMFISLTIDKVLPKLSEDDYHISLRNYMSWDLGEIQYQLDTYDVIQLHGKHIQYIDLDEWIVCCRIDSTKIASFLYGHTDLVKTLHNNPENVQNAPLVMSRHDIDHNINKYTNLGEEYRFLFENVKYIVDNEMQKANILKKGMAVGFMPKIYYDSALNNDPNIQSVEGVDIGYYIESNLILINKNSKHRKKITKLYRSIERDLVTN